MQAVRDFYNWKQILIEFRCLLNWGCLRIYILSSIQIQHSTSPREVAQFKRFLWPESWAKLNHPNSSVDFRQYLSQSLLILPRALCDLKIINLHLDTMYLHRTLCRSNLKWMQVSLISEIHHLKSLTIPQGEKMVIYGICIISA